MKTTNETPVNNTTPKICKPTKKSKQADGRPRRSLSAYNIFFGIERKRIMKETAGTVNLDSMSARSRRRAGKHANVGFANLARIVGENWKNIDTATKLKLEEMARQDKARYEREMEEWRAGKSFAKNGDAAVVSPGASVSDSEEEWSPEKNDVDQKKEAVKDVIPASKAPTPAVTTATNTWQDNFPESPFKFNEVEESEESPFCLPCTAPPKPIQQRPQQRSLFQPSEEDYLPSFPRRNTMDTAAFVPAQLFQPANYFRRVSDVSVDGGMMPMADNGGMFPMMQPEVNCVQFVPMMGNAYTHPMFSMGMNNMNPIQSGTTSPVSIDMLMKDDVFRGLYENRMRRRSIV